MSCFLLSEGEFGADSELSIKLGAVSISLLLRKKPTFLLSLDDDEATIAAGAAANVLSDEASETVGEEVTGEFLPELLVRLMAIPEPPAPLAVPNVDVTAPAFITVVVEPL